MVDVAEAVAARGGLRAVMGGGAWALAVTGGSVVVALGKATLAGTVLFSVFESALAHGQRALGDFDAGLHDPPGGHELSGTPRGSLGQVAARALPFVAGALAGASYGGATVVLDSVTARHGSLQLLAAIRQRVHHVRAALRPAVTVNAVEWSVAFGCYFFLRYTLGIYDDGDAAAAEGRRDELAQYSWANPWSQQPSPDGAIPLPRVVALAAAACGGGAAQVVAAGVASDGLHWRSVWGALTPRSVAVASVGLAAYELAKYLD